MRLRGRRALVTGASGYIGPTLCRALVERGLEVHAVARRLNEGEAAGVRTWSRDLTLLDDTRALLDAVRPDFIFHLAGLAAGARTVSLVVPTFASNLTTSVNLLTAAAERGCERFVLAGSLEEPDRSEADPVPSSPYAAGKWAASAYARMFHALFASPVVIARVFMVYGPGHQSETKLIPYVARSLLSGQQPRLSGGGRRIDWVYVDDVAEALLRLATAPGVEGDTVDVGSGQLVSIRELVSTLVRITGSPLKPEFGALPDREMEQVRVADADRTAELVAWRATTPLETGLGRTIDWYRSRLQGGPEWLGGLEVVGSPAARTVLG